MARTSIAVGAACLGCASGPSASAEPQVPATGDAVEEADTPVAEAPTPSDTPLRVLVTGFNDWRDLGDPPNVWRCHDNPSCRLLLGDARLEAPSSFEGPIVGALVAAAGEAGRDISWTFATLPVTWEVAQTVDYGAHDVVVHLGLGVYERTDAVFVEAGAYNRRRGKDAAGDLRDEPVDAAAPQTVLAPEAVAEAVASVDHRSFGTLEVIAMQAREANTYLCNETHFHALQAVAQSEASGGRLAAAYFVHIPYAVDEDYQTLATGVAGVIAALLAER